jgi:hypothetical protein
MMPLATKSQKHKRITKYFVKLSAFVPSWQKFLSLLLLFCSFNLTPELRLEGEIKGQFKFFTTDKLGNVFVLTQKNDIQKFDKKGKKLTEANFKVLGDATMIDAGNPLEIYVFYKDQNKLVYFDNMLNYRGETDLYKTLGVNNIQAVCRSYDNGFWFFDPDNFKLKKADKQGDLQSESINLANVADTILTPQMLLDDGKFVYLKTNNDRLLVFDILGNYIKTIPLEKFTSFQTKEENLIYSTYSDLYTYNPSTFEKDSYKLNQNTLFNNASFLNIRLENDRLYLQDSATIGVYSF